MADNYSQIYLLYFNGEEIISESAELYPEPTGGFIVDTASFTEEDSDEFFLPEI
ncbi:hypothetical protein Metlim_0722 [Methanoplanus limicola DSM 2279]|uniref:Uncharacterized protein n=1 Tax=Methanoplanus limicola DSM 2279 TaxID=937775 RepID=H1YWC3_9EURY|nr:hypothetical protein Metlim_0722 [Methanoplanus limicola DSM 2279]